MQRLHALRRSNRLEAWLEIAAPALAATAAEPEEAASRAARLVPLLSAIAGDGISAKDVAQRLDDICSLLEIVPRVPGGRISLVAALAEASAFRLAPPSPPPAPASVVQRPALAASGSAAPALAVSHRGFERSRTTMQDFVQSYFMFHGLDSADTSDVFRYLPGTAPPLTRQCSVCCVCTDQLAQR